MKTTVQNLFPVSALGKLDCYMTYKCMKAIFEQA